MTIFKQCVLLLQKEITIEFRQRYAIGGILLYLISSLFIVFVSVRSKSTTIQPLIWNIIFWIILLFTSINTIAKSFIQDRKNDLLYYYSIINPTSYIVAKTIYNSLLMVIMSFVAYFFYTVLMGNPIQNHTLFYAAILLASLGLSTVLTLISALASKAKHSHTLMAVMGFPVILPVLLLIIKISMNAIDGLDPSVSVDEIVSLIAIILIVITTSLILFPYLWRSN